MSVDSLARVVLAAVDFAGVRWALFEAPPADFGAWGDCDIVADDPIVDWWPEVGVRLQAVGVYPLVWSHYDVGRGDALWLWDTGDGSVFHLDVLSDPHGVGRLALATAPLLVDADSQSGFPVVDRRWQHVYRLSKDLSKRRWDRLAETGMVSTGLEADCLESVFGSRVATEITNELIGASSDRWRTAAPALRRARLLLRARRRGWTQLGLDQLRRFWSRLSRPVGVWIHVYGGSAGDATRGLTEEFGASLRTVPVDWRGRRAPGTGLRLRLALLRPMVVITWAAEPIRGFGLTRADLQFDSRESSDWQLFRASVARALTTRLHGRLR
jgi:hypothetical protein